MLTGAKGASGGLAILWKLESITITESILNANWQWEKVYVKHLHYFFRVINVYGPNNNAQKRILWQSLAGKVQEVDNEVTILGGDFNAILSPEDKKGGKGWIS